MPTSLQLIHRSLRRYRRPLIALLVGIAVAAGVSAASRSTGTTAPALVTLREIDGGALVTAADVARVDVPLSALPERYLSDPNTAIGRIATVPLPANAVVLESSILTAGGLVAEGLTAVPVSVMAIAGGLVRVGDRVDLYGVTEDDRPGLLASRARVVAIVGQDGVEVLGASSATGSLTLVVEVSPSAAPALVAQAAQGALGFTLR